MKYGQHPLYTINIMLFSFLVGIILANILSVSLVVSIGIAIALLMLCICGIWHKSFYTIFYLALLFFAVGFCRYGFYHQLPADNISRFIGQSKEVTGVLQSQPVKIKSNDGLIHMRYELTAVTAKNNTVSGGYYLYTVEKETNEAQVGDEISAFGKVREINSYKNPGRIDNALQARINGIYASVSAGKSAITVKAQPDNMRLLKKIAQIRAHVLQSMEKAMPSTDAAAVFAMLFGGYSGIDPELLASFTTTGIVHILSVSGSHITLLAGTIIAIGRLFGIRQQMNIAILLIVIGIYCVFCGLVPPVLRAAMMGLLSYVGIILGKDNQSRYLLSIVVLFMLIIWPQLAFNISFQLSFAATAGLLYTATFFQQKLYRLPRFMSISLSITLGAQFFCLPFLSWYFHTISLSSLVANIIVVPFIDVIIIAALAAVIISQMLPFLTVIIFVVCSLLLGVVYEMTSLLSLLPGSSIYLPYLTVPGSIVYYFCWFLLLNKRASKYCHEFYKRHQDIWMGLFCAVLILYALHIYRGSDLAVHFIDVGQGDAALIVTPHKKAVMIDTGGVRESDFDIGKNVDVPYLYHYGVTHLAGIFLSHVDADHSAGAYGIANAMAVDKVFISRGMSEQYAALWHISTQSDIMNKIGTVDEDQTFVIDGVSFTVVNAPTANDSDKNNENSVVIKMVYKDFSALFTGDLPTVKEEQLLKKDYALRSTVLKVGHHGSKTSSSDVFLDRVRPRWAVISVGRGNSYGHPTDEVLQRLAAHDIQIYRTDHDGAVTFYTDGHKCTVEVYNK